MRNKFSKSQLNAGAEDYADEGKCEGKDNNKVYCAKLTFTFFSLSYKPVYQTKRLAKILMRARSDFFLS